MTQPRPDGTFRFLTWNLWGDGPDQSRRLGAAVEVIAELEPDAVAIQENVPLGASTFAQELAGMLGYRTAACAPIHADAWSSSAVISPHRLLDSWVTPMPTPDVERLSIAAHIETPAGAFVAASAHLWWGSRREVWRARQVAAISRAFDERFGDPGVPSYDGPLVVVGMDANAEPDALSMRFMRGLDPFEGEETWWTDAFAVAGSGDGTTSTARNRYTEVTAEEVGILRPDLLKDRRIDYVYSRGYAHGRPGTPLNAFVVGHDPLVSDHYGVCADLLR